MKDDTQRASMEPEHRSIPLARSKVTFRWQEENWSRPNVSTSMWATTRYDCQKAEQSPKNLMRTTTTSCESRTMYVIYFVYEGIFSLANHIFPGRLKSRLKKMMKIRGLKLKGIREFKIMQLHSQWRWIRKMDNAAHAAISRVAAKPHSYKMCESYGRSGTIMLARLFVRRCNLCVRTLGLEASSKFQISWK